MKMRKVFTLIFSMYLGGWTLYCGVRIVQGVQNRPDPVKEIRIENNDIHHPDNWEYVNEVAFNLEIDPDSVTQEMFNERYGIK